MSSDEEVPTDETLEADAEEDEDEEDDDEGADDFGGVLGDLLVQLEDATEEVDEIADAASTTIVEGTAAGGSVAISITGALEAVGVRIDPALVDPEDVALLEDAVLAALRDALAQVRFVQEDLAEAMEDTELDLSALLGNLGHLANLGGLGLPDFGSASNPEDLIAGLTGALGNLAGGPGGFGSLTDLMGGLGLDRGTFIETAGRDEPDFDVDPEPTDTGTGNPTAPATSDEAATERPE